MTEPILKLVGITKRFPAVTALDRVDFDVRAGEVHALLGENGAGKSTLMKVLDGVYRADEGHIYLDGQMIDPENPLAAKKAGIVLIHQELSLVPQMSVAENIFLGSLPSKGLGRVDRRTLFDKAGAILEKLQCDFSPRDNVGQLSIAKKQMVEIARALVFTPKIVVFDEPTASLTDYEKVVLFKVIRDLKSQGVGIVYISHRMDEVFEVTDRVSVLRDGTYRGTVMTAETDEDEVTRMMIGRSLEKSRRMAKTELGETVLEVRNLSVPELFENVSFTVRKGEIVGMYGLVGAGRSEVAETLFGLRQAAEGQILIDGEETVSRSPDEAITRGIALVPESRKEQGLVLGMNCRDNITLSHLGRVSHRGWLNQKEEISVFEHYHRQLDIRTPGWKQKVLNLSGGNQLKVVIGKWLGTHPRILILDEPTRGIDVGSKAEIHNLIRDLADDGYAILVISSEMPEVMGVSNRILALYHGRVTAEFDADQVTEDELVMAITGSEPNKQQIAQVEV
ncbi:MAG: sugar ABC transporter ATP-binding protein [Geminicoccaceae bacterium]